MFKIPSRNSYISLEICSCPTLRMECTSIAYNFLCLFKVIFEEIYISEFLIETIIICILSQCLKGSITSLDILVLMLEKLNRLDNRFNGME